MTIIKGAQLGYTIGGLPQNYSINEGALSQIIQPITVAAIGKTYGDYFHATFEIQGTTQAVAILLECATLNTLAFTRVGNTYTLSSRYIKNGVEINNWAYFGAALRTLSLRFTNSDISQSFAVVTKIWAGTNDDYTLNTLIAEQNINVNIASVPDMTGIPQTKTGVAMAAAPKTLVDYGMASVQIADLQQAAKTYRVTFTAANQTNGTGSSNVQLWYRDTANGISGDFQTSFTLSGTQAYINSVLAGTTPFGTLGFAIGNYSANYVGSYGVNYVQEVLTSTEPGAVVPYVQETGTLTFTNLPTPVWTPNNSLVYNEDETLSGFTLGTLVDSWGSEWTAEPYTITASVLGTYPGTNPMTLTFSGDGSVDQVVTFTGTKAALTAPAHPLQNLILIPPADHVAPISVNILITSNIGTAGVTTRYNQNTTIAVGTTHGDFSLTGAKAFVIGANSFDLGAITDLAVSKNYSVTLDFQTAIAATLGSSGSGGTSTWNATGGTGGFGRLTISGTKTQVNSHLAAIDYTTTGGAALSDFVNIIYTQTQTTNSVDQGTQNIFVGNTIQWQAGNGINAGQSAFVYDQDVAMTWNLVALGGQLDDVTSYTAKLVFSTPLSVANLGSVTAWTRETDLIWTKTGTKATLNAALAAVVFNPPAALVSNFTLDIYVYNGATLLADSVTFGSTKTVYLRTLVTVTWDGAALSYDQDTVKTFTNLATLNSNFNAGTYTLELVTSVATGGSITGWTTVNSTTFSKTDTKANLQAALNSLVFTPGPDFVSIFTFTLKSYRSSVLINTSVDKTISIGTVYQFNNTATALTFNQDSVQSWAPFGSFSTNFDPAKTYTIEIVTSLASVGTFTGWTQTSTTVHSKTDTGANLITAMNSLEFNASLSNQTPFTITTRIYRTAILVYTSIAKNINIGVIYSISLSASNQTYDQDRTKTFVNLIIPNSVFNNSKIYTFVLTVNRVLTETSAEVGVFTGWTKTSATTFEKTDTGINLIAACASLEFIPAVSFNLTFTINVSAIRSFTTLVTSANKTISIGNIYNFSQTVVTPLVYNGGPTVINDTTLGTWFTDSFSYVYQITVTSNTPDVTLSGAGWTTIAPTILSFTGNKTAINNLLTTGVTVTPGTYFNGTHILTYIVSRLGLLARSSPITRSMTNKPVFTSYYNGPNFGDNYDYFLPGTATPISTIQTLTVPDDGSQYRIRIYTTTTTGLPPVLFGSISSSSLTWSSPATGEYVSSFGTQADLYNFLSDGRLTASASVANRTAGVQQGWYFRLEGDSPAFVPVVTGGNYRLRNAAEPAWGGIGLTVPKNSTFTIALPPLTPKIAPSGVSIDYFDPSKLYTVTLTFSNNWQTTPLQLITLNNWGFVANDVVQVSRTIYSVTDTIANISALFASTSMTTDNTDIMKQAGYLLVQIYDGANHVITGGNGVTFVVA